MNFSDYDYCGQASDTKVLVPLIKDGLHFLQQRLDDMFAEKPCLKLYYLEIMLICIYVHLCAFITL